MVIDTPIADENGSMVPETIENEVTPNNNQGLNTCNVELSQEEERFLEVFSTAWALGTNEILM